MVTVFGVRPDGSVYIEQLATAAQGRLQLTTAEFATGLDYATGTGWAVRQGNGLVRITESGFSEV